MCGILIWINRKHQVIPEQARSALQLQNHRGPDHQGLLFWQRSDTGGLDRLDVGVQRAGRGACLALGCNRLSIIDLHPRSNQPMFSDDGKYALTFNGEIYNYVELREELVSEGVTFRTNSDSEVLLKGLVRWGREYVLRLNGMWAFAFLDMERETVLLSRDRYGKKPLFYYVDDVNFVAASEPKTIFTALEHNRRKVRPEHVATFLTHNFWPTPEDGNTLYQEVSRLGADQCLLFDMHKHESRVSTTGGVIRALDNEPDPEGLPQDIEAAVLTRLRSDVPVAVLLSGGTDSSIIAAYLAQDKQSREKVTLYTGRTGHGLDLEYARIAARSLGLALTEVEIPYGPEMTEVFRRLTYQYELPVPALGNAMAMERMFHAMSADGIRVVLDGTGGDEVFGGYFDFYGSAVINGMLDRGEIAKLIRFVGLSATYRQFPLRTAIRHIVGYRRPPGGASPVATSLALRLAGLASRVLDMHPPGRPDHTRGPTAYALNNFTDLGQHENFSPRPHTGVPRLFDSQVYDIQRGRLPNWLYQNDQNSMMHSVETRSPLLDHRLMKYLRLPDSTKFNRGFNKYTLRMAMPPTMDPRVTWRRDKQGFRWWPPKFLESNRESVANTIGYSSMLGDFFDLGRLMSDLRDPSKPVNPFFALRLYSVALLEEVHCCTV